MRSFPQASMELNGSAKSGADIKRDVHQFASTVSFTGSQKLCFVDEADNIPQPIQAALRAVIEKRSDNCRFILAVNDVSKLIPAIRSRLLHICFDIPAADRTSVQNKLLQGYEAKLKRLQVEHDPARLKELVGIHYPDLASIANQIEFAFPIKLQSMPDERAGDLTNSALAE